MKIVVTEPHNSYNAALVDDTIYIGADTFENGTWAESLVHEYTHFAEGSEEYNKLIRFLKGDEALHNKTVNELLQKGGYGFDADKTSDIMGRYEKKQTSEEETSKALRFDLKTDVEKEKRVLDQINAYQKRIDTWDGKTEGFSFVLCETPEQISELEINNKKIGKKQVRIDASKIKNLIKNHPEMSIDVIKKLPYLIIDPIIVLDSKTVPNRLVLFGEVYAAEKPVMVALEINPTTRSGNSTYVDIIKIASAYTRSNTQNIINSSKIRYVDKNKSRVNEWLKVNRLQLPLPNSQSLSADISISQTSEKINPSDKKTSNDARFDIKTEDISTEQISDELTEEELNYIKSYKSELGAHLTANLLGNENFIDRLVREDTTIAEKVLNKISDLTRMLESFSNPEARAEYKKIKKAEKLYLDAVENAGYAYVGRKIIGAIEEREEKVKFFAKEDYDPEKAGIHSQINNSQAKLNSMRVVFSGNTPLKVGKAYEAGTWAIGELKKYGFQADRQNFGKVFFDETSIRDAMKYLDTDAEKVSIVAIYKVIKQGIQIGEHGNHKERGKHTITFAAPVEINATRGNMAVVVNMRNNKYKVHRILMPDGSIFKFQETKNNAEREMQRGVPERSLANATSSASSNSISETSEKINPSDKKTSNGARFDIKSEDISIEQIKSATENVGTFDKTSSDIRFNRKSEDEIADQITADLTDAERYEILKDKQIAAPIYDGKAEKLVNIDINRKTQQQVKKAIILIAEKLGVLRREINFNDVNVKITLSKSNLRESISKDATPAQIAKLLTVIEPVAESSVLIERHDNRYYYDTETVYFDNLLGAYVDGHDFVPVRFGLKHSKNGSTTLYVIVDENTIGVSDINKIKENKKTEVVKTPALPMQSPEVSRSVIYSISQIVPFVNSKDLLRYIPDDFLSNEQRSAKWEAIAETVKKTNSKNDKKFVEFISSGALDSARQMVFNAAITNGYTIETLDGHNRVAKSQDGQIKSLDAITYDDNDNIIPISQRFNSSTSDIRFNLKPGDKVTKSKGEYQKQKANYTKKRVYSKTDVSKALLDVPYISTLPKSTQNDILDSMWYSLNTVEGDNQKDRFIESSFNRILRDLWQESREFANLSADEVREVELKLHKTIRNLAKHGGSPSALSKLEAEFAKSEAGRWRSKYNEAVKWNQVIGNLMTRAEKMRDIKYGTFLNYSL